MKDLIKKYNEYNQKKKDYDKKRKEIGKVLQSEMEEQGIDKQVEDNVEVKLITRQGKKKVDEEKLMETLQEHNIDATKTVPDLDKLEVMIDEGEMPTAALSEIADCISVSEYSYVQAKELN